MTEEANDRAVGWKSREQPGITGTMTLQPRTTVLGEAGQTIPADDEIIEGTALIDESAITGETDPVICEAGGPHSDVLAGAHVISGRIRVRITSL